LARHVARRMRGTARAVSRALLGLDLVDSFLGPEADSIESSWAAHRDSCMSRIRAFTRELPSDLSADEILARMDRLTALTTECMEPDLAVYFVKDATAKALERLWLALGLPAERFPDLVRGFEGNRTTEMNADWSRLVLRLASDPGLREFCASGCRAG